MRGCCNKDETEEEEESSCCDSELAEEVPSASSQSPTSAALVAAWEEEQGTSTAATGHSASSTLQQQAETAVVKPRLLGSARVPETKEAGGKEQESDLMEKLAQGPNMCDELTNSVRLVSLGCYCGPKLSFQKMGRGAETLPFDWMRTRLDGLFHFMRSDFDGFFNFVTQLPVPGTDGGMVAYRAPLHSFWHDDPRDASMHERYGRRIARFQNIDASSSAVLFVRVAGDTSEVRRAPELLHELESRFGAQAHLLLVLNFQEGTTGPALIQEHGNLMVNLLDAKAHMRGSSCFGHPYVDPVLTALNWVVGRETDARMYATLQEVEQLATPTDWGERGLGGLQAFEPVE